VASVRLKLEGPYDLPLSVRLAAKWSGRRDESPERLRRAVRIDNAPAVLEVRQVSRRSAEVEARADGVRSRTAVEAKTRRWSGGSGG
jgi:hypothetical protein